MTTSTQSTQSEANPTSVLPGIEEEFRALGLKLRKDCQPESNLEEEVFQRYAWATFQSKRSRQNEAIAEQRWLSDPDNAQKF